MHIDSKKDVNNRINYKSNLKKNIQNLEQKDLKKILIKKGLVKKTSKAPLSLLRDIYLNSILLADISIIQ